MNIIFKVISLSNELIFDYCLLNGTLSSHLFSLPSLTPCYQKFTLLFLSTYLPSYPSLFPQFASSFLFWGFLPGSQSGVIYWGILKKQLEIEISKVYYSYFQIISPSFHFKMITRMFCLPIQGNCEHLD